jgi:mRNA interferase MazF
MAFAKGDVVLVPFPFTDLTAVRVRPALVVSSRQYNDSASDVILAMVTSREHDAPTDYGLRDWQSAGLIYPSWIRAKLATLEQRLVQFSPGRLSTRDLRAVETRLRRALGL